MLCRIDIFVYVIQINASEWQEGFNAYTVPEADVVGYMTIRHIARQEKPRYRRENLAMPL